ncbi:uncharacterized protein At4g06598-like isoform X1 [Cucurbita moschata]|uniref:Uncharacterized protein At4g06598-like isoform X1 n=1 Tax=Cucurbita moschata TaxID=3662 RepID=A0A6J1E439_CUCMO|nr:uncharacterized protein At4g06598-like isoform X1 [Cucurbita moschata]
MENSKGSSNVRNFMSSGKHALLPPKSPFPSVSPSYTEFVPNTVIGAKAVQRPRDGNSYHQRTSSESILIEEQPSWLDDLLNEPETPVRRVGHRRSSSDSFAYTDAANVNFDSITQEDFKYANAIPGHSWLSQEFDHQRDARHASFYTEANVTKQKNRVWESSLSTMNNPIALHSPRENIVIHTSGPLSAPQEADGLPSTASEKQDPVESGSHDPKVSSERKDVSHGKSSSSDTENKRAKQQFAQRSRVRKLQYIAELERKVQALQAEGSEVSAELEFLNQQHLILSMENNALKQRLENLAQEQLIKYLEQEVLEREIGRLRAMHQQQHQQQQHQQQQQPQPLRPSSSHRRSSSKDLDNQFANLSLKQKDSGSSRDPVTGPVRS